MMRRFRSIRQLDYRPDGWLPLGVREGDRAGWHILWLGWLGRITLWRVPSPRDVTVELNLDMSSFALSMLNASYASRELAREHAYRRRIAGERLLGKSSVGALLDDMCRDYGWDPVEVWRLPRELEERDSRDRAALRARLLYGWPLTDPQPNWGVL